MTHPFHPLKGREFALVTYRHNWGEDRVYFHDEDGTLSALPANWTSLAPKDPFREVAAGRCLLRFVDLMELLALACQIGEREVGTGEAVADVVSPRFCRRCPRRLCRIQLRASEKPSGAVIR